MRQLAIARRVVLLVLLAGPLVLPEHASATGFFINQQSVLGRGRVDAGNSSAAEEIGTIFFNPAGLTSIFNDGAPGDWRVSLGLQLIVPRSNQTNQGTTSATPALGLAQDIDGQRSHNPTDATPVPDFYLARRIAGGDGAIGIGMNSPFGLAIKSPSDWFGRYDAIEASLTTINLTAVGAYRVAAVPGLTLGGGLDLQYAKTKLVTAIPYPFAPGGPTAATDGRVETSGHAWTPGFNVGVHYAMNDDQTRLGLHYRSGMKHEIRGTASISGLLPPFADLNGGYGARADIELPAIATAGIWQRLGKWALMAELEWYQWSKFHEIRTQLEGLPDTLRLENYRDTYAVALGADRWVNDNLTLRGGVKFDRTPTQDGFRDTTVPDSNRLWLGLGATWRHSKATSVDFAFNHVFFRNTTVDATRTFFDGTPAMTSVRTRGGVTAVVNTIALAGRWSF